MVAVAPLPERPRLRALEIVPFREHGRRSFLIEDPAGFLESPLQVSSAALLLLTLCDGRRTQDEIRALFTERTKQPIESAELTEFLTTMDGSWLLDSPRFQVRREELELAFAGSPTRTAAHVGAAYSADPSKLAAELDGWLSHGIRGGRVRGRLRGLVTPHIDFHRGGAGYGRAYSPLADRERPEVVVLLGTAHAGESARFIVCPKGFETPLGFLPADRSFLGRLEARLPADPRRGLLAHRREHSLEFQAVWLAHLFPGEPRPAIVPILATSFDDLMLAGADPLTHPETAPFLAALRATWLEEKRRVLVIAGADLSHVGPRFGDTRRTSPEFMTAVGERDRATLDAAASGAAGSFFSSVAAHRNCDRICSVASIFAALHTVGSHDADVTVYDQAIDPHGELAVTFGGVALYGADTGPGLARTVAARRTIRQSHRDVTAAPLARPAMTKPRKTSP